MNEIMSNSILTVLSSPNLKISAENEIKQVEASYLSNRIKQAVEL